MKKRGVNKCTFVGNVSEPKVHGEGDRLVVTCGLATSVIWKDQQSGEEQERTEWHNLVFFKGLAKVMAEHLTKGTKLYVECQHRTRKFQDQAGVDRYASEFVVDEFQFMGGGQQAGAAPDAAGQAPAPMAGADGSGNPAAGFGDDFTDDIPF